MTTTDLVALLERHHRDTHGIELGTLRAYADRLADERDYKFDDEAFLSDADAALTDRTEWIGGEVIYLLDDERGSVYPATFHEELGGSTDAETYVGFLQDVEGFPPASADEDLGVPERELESALSVVGQISRDEARSVIERQRENGTLVEDADQHPNAGVYRAEDADGITDQDAR